MKKIIFLSLALVALVGCKQDQGQEPTPDIPAAPEGAILVQSGGILNVDVTKAGSRPNANGTFLLKTESTPGDKIGVLAVYSTNPLMSTLVTDVPNWAKLQFENLPAEATTATADTKITSFIWNGEYQFFDKGNYIHLFAYYPYADGTTATEGVEYAKSATPLTDAKPTIKVTLQPETIDNKADAAIVQPDVMFAQHADGLLTTGEAPNVVAAPKPINRTSTEAQIRLSFKHLLSQLVFKIQKEGAQVQGDVYLVKMTIKVPKTATYTLGNGMAATVAAASADADFVTYTIQMKQDIDNGIYGLQIGENGAPVTVNNVPLMMFPFTEAELQKCSVTMQLYFSTYGVVNFPLTGSDGNTNKMNLDAFGDKGMTQGGKNVIVLTVNHADVQLRGTVAAWGEKVHGDDIVLD